MNELIDTWHIHNRINLYLLDAINEDHLTDIPASKGRNVGDQFAHMHNVRMMWLKVAAPDLLEGVQKIEKGNITKKLLASELDKSSKVIASLLTKGL